VKFALKSWPSKTNTADCRTSAPAPTRPSRPAAGSCLVKFPREETKRDMRIPFVGNDNSEGKPPDPESSIYFWQLLK